MQTTQLAYVSILFEICNLIPHFYGLIYSVTGHIVIRIAKTMSEIKRSMRHLKDIELDKEVDHALLKIHRGSVFGHQVHDRSRAENDRKLYEDYFRAAREKSSSGSVEQTSRPSGGSAP